MLYSYSRIFLIRPLPVSSDTKPSLQFFNIGDGVKDKLSDILPPARKA